MRFLVFLAVLSSLLFASCTPQRAIYNYLEDVKDTTMAMNFYAAEPVIQKNDLLSIHIYSVSLDPEIDQLYNLHMNRGSSGSSGSSGIGSSGNSGNSGQNAYLVDQQGNIEMPRIGVIRAEGLKKSELAEQIKQKLQGQLIEPSVIIRFTNFRIVVMGEVGSPGVKNVPVENLTLLEALAMAGDITEFGKKKEVKILRENDGRRQLGIVDVTTRKMFESPYYQLQQNDVILVEQTKYKIRRTEQQRITQQVGFALSIITSITLLYNIFSN